MNHRVPASQKAIDALPFNSGMWTVEGVKGLFVRCRMKSKSFMLQRRVNGKLVQRGLGQIPVKQACEKAKKIWNVITQTDQDELCAALRRIRAASKLSQERLARQIGIAAQTYARFERGDQEPRAIKTLSRMADIAENLKLAKEAKMFRRAAQERKPMEFSQNQESSHEGEMFMTQNQAAQPERDLLHALKEIRTWLRMATIDSHYEPVVKALKITEDAIANATGDVQ